MGSRIILKWQFKKLIRTIVASLLNKYDFFMCVEGGTGIGKSTLAYHIGHKVSLEFRKLYRLDEELVSYYYERVGRGLNLTEEEFCLKILKLKEEKAYQFRPAKVLVYTQDALQKTLASWHTISIPDEMINITFNRDFFSNKQKDIIKMINMFRDHENLTIACVPQFQNLDNQIKNLTKMKITVKKRGLGIIHTPNSSIYCKDKWDSATNEKIERNWIIKKIMNPNYSKLTTFRGLIRFPPMNKKQEAIYQAIKNEKRTNVLKDDMGIDTDEKSTDPLEIIFDRVTSGGCRNGYEFDGLAVGLGMTSDALRSKISVRLKKAGKPHLMTHYFWENKKKLKKIDEERFGSI